MKGNKMSKEYVYKPIDLVELERKYSPYVVIDSRKNLDFISDSGELKDLLKNCEASDGELYIYALQSVVRPQEINPSDDYNDDEEDDENSETNSQKINVDNVIDEITKVFNNILKEIVSKNK